MACPRRKSDPDIIEEMFEQGCDTYRAGNDATSLEIDCRGESIGTHGVEGDAADDEGDGQSSL